MFTLSHKFVLEHSTKSNIPQHTFYVHSYQLLVSCFGHLHKFHASLSVSRAHFRGCRLDYICRSSPAQTDVCTLQTFEKYTLHLRITVSSRTVEFTVSLS